MPTMYHYGRM